MLISQADPGVDDSDATRAGGSIVSANRTAVPAP
jgi:hypothetical protein